MYTYVYICMYIYIYIYIYTSGGLKCCAVCSQERRPKDKTSADKCTQPQIIHPDNADSPDNYPGKPAWHGVRIFIPLNKH